MRPIATALFSAGMFLVGAVAYAFLPVAALPKVVIDSGTVCSLSERFWAVTVIVSSSFDDAAVSAANTRNDPSIAATPAETRQFFDIPIGILPRNRIVHPMSAYGTSKRQTMAAPLCEQVSGRSRFNVKKVAGPHARSQCAGAEPRTAGRPAAP